MHSRRWAIDAAMRASTRAAATVHQEMKRGLTSLATIAAISPFVGLFRTVLGINNTFQGVDGERTSIMAMEAESLSESLVPAAFGLATAVLALWLYRYFSSKLDAFKAEMKTATLDLANSLSRHHV